MTSEKRPFNLEEAKAGKPFQTKSGHPCRFVADAGQCVGQSIAVVGYGDELTLYWPDGAFSNDRRPTGLDLVMCDGYRGVVRDILNVLMVNAEQGVTAQDELEEAITALLKAVRR